MKETSEVIITRAINELRTAGKNPQQIATDFMGGAVAVLVDSIGTAETSRFLHSFAAKVAETPELDNVLN